MIPKYKLYLITLLLTLITLYAYIKRSYKYATMQDAIDTPLNQTDQTDINAPIDYESDKYKESIVWFKGVGRC